MNKNLKNYWQKSNKIKNYKKLLKITKMISKILIYWKLELLNLNKLLRKILSLSIIIKIKKWVLRLIKSDLIEFREYSKLKCFINLRFNLKKRNFIKRNRWFKIKIIIYRTIVYSWYEKGERRIRLNYWRIKK